ncbi:MAG: carbohydrate ABC transporter permease [Acidobacteriota bacterium]
MSRKRGGILVNVLLVAGAAVTLLPLLWMISASFMPAGQANSEPPVLLPRPATLANYVTLFTRMNVARNFRNSLVLAFTVTFGSLLFNSMAGYAFAKLRFAGRDRLFAFLMGALAIPVQVAMLPLFLMVKSLGMINTLWGVIVPGLAGIFGIFLIRQYAQSIPDEVLEAARLDGAGEFRIYWKIVLPLLRPILVTLALFTFLGSWNDFLWPLVVLSDASRYTLPVALANLVGEHVQDTELMMAGSVLTVFPVLILFLFLQRYYVQGIMMGSVKE